MVRFLIFLVGMLTTNRPGGMRTVPVGRVDPYGGAGQAGPHAEGPDDGDTWFVPPQSPPSRPHREAWRAPERWDRGNIRTSPRRGGAHPAGAGGGGGPAWAGLCVRGG